MGKQEQRIAQETANIINRLALEDPCWQQFLRRQPSYRYFHIKGSDDRFFWTTEPLKQNGKKRFASGVYRFVKTKQLYKLASTRYHAKRKDAKARALALYYKAKERVER